MSALKVPCRSWLVPCRLSQSLPSGARDVTPCSRRALYAKTTGDESGRCRGGRQHVAITWRHRDWSHEYLVLKVETRGRKPLISFRTRGVNTSNTQEKKGDHRSRKPLLRSPDGIQTNKWRRNLFGGGKWRSSCKTTNKPWVSRSRYQEKSLITNRSCTFRQISSTSANVVDCYCCGFHFSRDFCCNSHLNFESEKFSECFDFPYDCKARGKRIGTIFRFVNS